MGARVVVYVGGARFELSGELLAERRLSSAPALSFDGAEAARIFVRTLSRELGAITALRTLLSRELLAPLSRWDDTEVLSEVARRLCSRRIRAFREALPPLFARDGAVEEEAQLPPLHSVEKSRPLEDCVWKAAIRHEPSSRWSAEIRLVGPPIWKARITLKEPADTPLANEAGADEG